ncbi:MAG TPA: hypothetical protein VFS00_23475 [Polyangiaceae bacterium]|nr:hypothetical protein [Polyangiaceae bacterium]
MVVYVETNWLVSCVLPHHPWRADARALLEAAEGGRCDLRVPAVAFLEARHVVERETADHAKAVTATASSLRDAARNHGNRKDLQELARALIAAEGSYRLPDPQRELRAFAARCQRFSFSDPAREQHALDDLMAKVAARGADVTDLYILAAVVADRDRDLTAPAAFLSTNSREFAVDGASSKLPRDVYTLRKLVYLDSFNLIGAEKLWEREAAKGWAPRGAPQADERLREAQKILYSLDAEKRDAALAALRALLSS